MAEPDPTPNPATGERWLCSHLVTLVRVLQPAGSETTLLEEISPELAWFSTGTAYPVGSRVEIVTDGFETSGVVTDCRQREDGFCLTVRFENFRWSPEAWRPDHLFKPPRKEAQKKRAAGP